MLSRRVLIRKEYYSFSYDVIQEGYDKLSYRREEILRYEIFRTILRKRVGVCHPGIYQGSSEVARRGHYSRVIFDAGFGVNSSCSANVHFDLHADRP